MSAESNTTTTSSAPVASPSKLFVGNIAFSLTDESLKSKFEAYGKVVSARIVTNPRGSSLGYGFVEMEDAESAQKAIAGLHKVEIDGRAINVEVTKDRTEPRKSTRAPRRGLKKDSAATDSTTTTTTSSDATTTSTTEGGDQAPRKRLGRRHPKKTATTEGDASTTTTPAAPVDSTTTTTAGKPRRRASKKEKSEPTSTTSPVATTTATTTTAETNGEKKPRKAHTPRVKKEDDTPREQSTDTLFVYNLPFTYNDAQLLELFKDYNAKSAHVIVKPRFNRSKGYGFVQFNSAEDQQKGLAVDKKSVEGRELNVKIALVDNKVPAATTTESTTTTTTA